jgi:hypothetical protein
MSEEELRGSRLPSGWTPLALLKHLAGVERRWFRWGFTAEQVDSPWPERGPEGGWHVGAEETAGEIKALFRDECARSRQIVAAARLDDVARTGGGFEPHEVPSRTSWEPFPQLIWGESVSSS